MKSQEIKIINLKSTSSTNDDCKKLLLSGIDSPVLILSKCQTAGKGRSGKQFISPLGGLYMSLALSLSLPFSSSCHITSCCAVAVCNALNMYGINAGIKWVNDIYYCNRKLAGILVEAVNDYNSNITTGVVIGIGMNIDITPDLSGDYQAISTKEIGVEIDKNKLALSIANELLVMSENNFDFLKYSDDYKKRSIVLGKNVLYSYNGTYKEGMAEDINNDGGLIVVTDNETTVLSSGEISLVIK